MADIVSKEKRSQIMSKIHQPQESKLLQLSKYKGAIIKKRSGRVGGDAHISHLEERYPNLQWEDLDQHAELGQNNLDDLPVTNINQYQKGENDVIIKTNKITRVDKFQIV